MTSQFINETHNIISSTGERNASAVRLCLHCSFRPKGWNYSPLSLFLDSSTHHVLYEQTHYTHIPINCPFITTSSKNLHLNIYIQPNFPVHPHSMLAICHNMLNTFFFGRFNLFSCNIIDKITINFNFPNSSYLCPAFFKNASVSFFSVYVFTHSHKHIK